MVQKKIVFDEQKKQKLSERAGQVKRDSVDTPEIPASEKQKAAKEAYKEALKEVYKEKIEAKERDKRMPEEGQAQGMLEQKKETAKKQELAKEKMSKLAMRQETFLFQAKTYFPFDFFPDTLLIDAAKITIVTKEFFATQQVKTVYIQDIFRCEVETSLFLANLIITFLHSPLRERMMIRIDKLRRNDALKAKGLIEALTYACSEGIDLSVLSYNEILALVKKLGNDKTLTKHSDI